MAWYSFAGALYVPAVMDGQLVLTKAGDRWITANGGHIQIQGDSKDSEQWQYLNHDGNRYRLQLKAAKGEKTRVEVKHGAKWQVVRSFAIASAIRKKANPNKKD